MDYANSDRKHDSFLANLISTEDAFSRLNEEEDKYYYSRDRFVSHLDSLALYTVEKLVGGLIIEKKPVMLDLMAGWDSHIPEHLNPAKVIGLGLNKNELEKNRRLSGAVIHDLNRNPELPFPGNAFDAVINTVSVDYMTHPLEVFRSVGRVLKPGGLFLVIFSNRMFPEKAVKIWKESGEDERIMLVEDFFNHTGLFNKPIVFVSKGKPRPKNDKYAHFNIPSDPIYAVYADKKAPAASRKARPTITIPYGKLMEKTELEEKMKAVRHTHHCPYCGDKMRKWTVPDNPFSQTWDNEHMYICFNDHCPYYVRGWDLMYKRTNSMMSYRCMYNPVKDRCSPIPVPSPRALKEGIED